MFVVIVARTAYQKEKLPVGAEIEIPVAESMQDPQETPRWLDNWVPWIIGTVVLILVAYGPQLVDQIANIDLSAGKAPTIRPW
jgi:hypothetical protein